MSRSRPAVRSRIGTRRSSRRRGDGMDLSLTGKRVLVTGGSKGIGRACAEAFLRQGAKVTLASRDAKQLGETAAALGGAGPSTPDIAAADLETAAERERLFAAWPDVDILVNNAGAIPGGNLFDLSLERWTKSWDLKVF